MKYVTFKHCSGNFTLMQKIDLNDFLNQDEQIRFQSLKDIKEKEMSKEDFDWYEEVLEIIQDRSNWYEHEIIDYEVNDWESYSDEDYIE